MIKSMLIFLILLISVGGVSKAQDRGLYASDALMWVLDEVYAASYDFPAVYLVEEKLDPIHSQIPEEGCFEVPAKDVKGHFQKVFDAYNKFYPDNVLPFKQAKNDLEMILGEEAFLQCSEESQNDWELIKVDHYRKVNGGVWIRFEESQRRP